MKKLTAIALVFSLLFAVVALPVGAAETEKKDGNPIIFIAGSSIDICDADGKIIPTGFDVLTDDSEEDEEDGISTDAIIESAMNILKPFVLQGLPFNKWDEYGKALYEELAPIWDETQLGGDGNAKYGTGVSPAEIAEWDNKAATVDTKKNGVYKLNDYKFRYDWRLSPYDHVDRLHAYIETIRETTGCDQVSLVGRCLGGNLINAYLEKYGSYGYVKRVLYDEVMSNGSAVFNDCFSGRIEFSDDHAQSYLLQAKHFGEQGEGIDLRDVNALVIELVETTVDYLAQSGKMAMILGGVEHLYNRLYEAFMPAMLLATGIGTWANYWCSVYEEDYDRALNLIFGEEGSENRIAYAGLIEKIEYIREHIVEARPELYLKFAEEYGVEIAVLADYGLANAPIIEHYDETGDTLVGVQDASLGATAGGLFDPLDDAYIEERIAAGYGEYISPDNRIDASTCLFPETTWFIKNNHHDYGVAYVYLGEYFTQYSNVKVNTNNRNIARFLVYDATQPGKFANMTEENMADGVWITEVNRKPTIKSVWQAFAEFMKTLFKAIKALFEGTLF